MNEQKLAAERAAFKELKKKERHHTVAETRYWCNQYRLFAEHLLVALAQLEKSTNAYTWRSPETAPNSGEPFLWKVDIHVVKGHLGLPDEIRHHAEVVRRSRSSMDSDGYWMGEYRSIPDMEFNSGKWMPLSVKK